MKEQIKSQSALKSSTRGDGTQIPTYEELFRLIRAAGPSNPAKARAVDTALAGARDLIKESYHEVDSKPLERRPSRLAGADIDVASLSVNKHIVIVLGRLLAKAPHWVRQDLISVDPAVRLRAEDTLAAMIAASLSSLVEL